MIKDDPVDVDDAPVPIEFTRVVSGTNSGYKSAGQEVFTDERSWSQFWEAHASIYFPKEPAPRVNFGTTMLVAIFRGTRSSTGYEVKITRVEEDAECITVHYVTIDPPEFAMVGFALTQPFEIVAIPCTAKRVDFVGVETIR